MAARIIGVTPESFDDNTHERHKEILLFLEEKNITKMPWVAIDDDRSYFPAGSPVIFTDPLKGFDAECKKQLDLVLAS